MPAGRVRVGVSGWTYAAWRGDFYPQGLIHRRELEYLSSRLDSVEVNGTFYALQRPPTFRSWRDQTQDDFTFAVKGGRFVTHLKRLVSVEEGLANFFGSGVLELGAKLGPVLWQLPASLAFNGETVQEFCRLLPPRPVRHAIEPRHASFDTDEASEVFRRYGIAVALSDSPRSWPLIDRDTTDFRYARLHGHTTLYTSSYSSRSLRRWAERCTDWADAGQDTYVFFDNDARGHAPHNAVDLATLVKKRRDEEPRTKS